MNGHVLEEALVKQLGASRGVCRWFRQSLQVNSGIIQNYPALRAH